MESLPDEIYLRIFRYLHKFEILYSFNNLNRRFHQLTVSYHHDIDLSQQNTSYKIVQPYLKYVLPTQAHEIIFLKLEGSEQYKAFSSHIGQLTNLRQLCLDLRRDNGMNTDDLKHFITGAL
ncbi:unnamed protein product [Rotaria sp. Silwood2]|nr:unnamed protein product [Rotaria sp. Silwood2]CAF3345048.1 unnamed protein product [Rotaria sp. Silwood2]CAF4424606.1 unnamed protein product [Rotaria sp. Silwood2]CAF4518605.1 unnamed protein product [Rotaria sp. Silwood2]